MGAIVSPKDELLGRVKEGLANGTITGDDLMYLVNPGNVPVVHHVPENIQTANDAPRKKLNVIDILFYIAGIILYASLMVMALQAGANSPALQVLITLGTGLVLWIAAYQLGKQPDQNEVRKGLINSMMLTGCLAVSSGGFIASYHAVGNQSSTSLDYAVALTLFLLGILHLLFDRIFRHIILITLGVLLLVAAFPAFMIALLSNMTIPPDIWALIGIFTGLLLGYGGVLAAKTGDEREYLSSSFESLGAFVILSSIYAAGLSSSVAPFWEILLPLTIYLAFFISIKRRSKNFLINGSFFLVLFLITISFKYFSGFGVAFCLMLSAVSILATAFMASNINKRFIKESGSRF